MSREDRPLRGRREIDSARVRERLTGTQMPPDPSIPVLPRDADRWPKDIVQRAAEGLRPAGVLVPLIERAEGLSVLLTRRSPELKSHAGQVSFPGGGMEKDDRDIAATALRETYEEVGIVPDLVSIAGYLPPSPTITGYSVTPVIGIVGSQLEIVVDPIEVEVVFEVPLSYLMDRKNQRDTTRELHGRQVMMAEFHHSGQRIWGATASILIQLRKVLL